ncbi:ABC transporter family substrate-binding protein [Streptomyces sp. AV19]|uniref:ABC transporter family substrate-binding protein n=1 Tax=Streptomyces sp. AV19 TaxID=2793068 RepID=UPI0018FE43B6|nr:ABC transporter family substrate-binding protein [Streptomyces sp. AV19]MBH1935623.1 ABC transporter family substrate-binding protein [Streptomyces sp. AV19]MDG4534510.1 ABC transporter family substrate-binding protein [Streptomyces sp. AV19]
MSIRTHSRPRRPAALLTAGLLLPLSVLAGCGGGGTAGADVPDATQDIAAAPRSKVADKGALTWAVDALPATYNVFQSDVDATSQRVAAAVLPTLFTLDVHGRPQRDPDYLTAADVVGHEPKQVVLYRLNPRAVWSDGTPVSAADFEAQWKALRGKDSAFWTTGNAGYDRIERVERGADAHEVKVTFARPYADWAGLFTPLYPRAAMGTGNAFNDSMRKGLTFSAGPFQVAGRDDAQGTLALVRNPRWWGDRAKLDRLVLRAVPRGERADALANGGLDVAEVTPAAADRIVKANQPVRRKGDDANKRAAASGAAASAASAASAAPATSATSAAPTAPAPGAPAGFRDLTVHRALEPAYTQLALNGASGPLSDERVRRAVARAIDRKALAEFVLAPLGLPADPLGSHVLVAGQPGYEDNSDALGAPDPGAARDLLADAGWKEGKGEPPRRRPAQAGPQQQGGRPDGGDGLLPAEARPEPEFGGDVQPPEDDKGSDGGKGGFAPVRFKDGKKLALRFVLPKGAGSEPLREVGARIARRLEAVGIRTEIIRVEDAGFFKDHVASGDFDLALYSWPASAFPATDARPIFAKPQPAADGSLQVEQNYTRVGTDQIDRLFDQASTELDADAARDLVLRADARIWAAAAAIPLYQRPELVAVRRPVANAGAFGLASPRYQDVGFLR